MMSRTAASTSSDTSRLVVRNAANRSSKPDARWSRRIANAPSHPVPGARAGSPGGAEVGEPSLDIVDRQKHGDATREIEFDLARWRFRLPEADGEQVEHVVGAVAIDAARAQTADGLEMKRSAAPLMLAGEQAPLLFPCEAVHRQDQPLLRRQPDDVGNLHHRVLHVRGHDREVLLVECKELEL